MARLRTAMMATVAFLSCTTAPAHAKLPWRVIDQTDQITDETQRIYIKTSQDYDAYGETGVEGAILMIGCGIGDAVGFEEADLSSVVFLRGSTVSVTYRVDDERPVETLGYGNGNTVAVRSMLADVMRAEKRIVVRYQGYASTHPTTRVFKVSNRDRIVKMECAR